MADTCPHGFPADICVICETLDAGRRRASPPPSGPGPSPARTSVTRPAPPTPSVRGAAPAQVRGAAPAADPGGRLRRLARSGPRQGSGAPARPADRHRLSPASAVLALVAVVLVVAAGWAAVGLAFALLRILELAAAVLVASWGGYRVGLARGRRDGRAGRDR